MECECTVYCNISTMQKFPTDKAYFIAKEISTTECTHLKDLEVITVVRNAHLSISLHSLI